MYINSNYDMFAWPQYIVCISWNVGFVVLLLRNSCLFSHEIVEKLYSYDYKCFTIQSCNLSFSLFKESIYSERKYTDLFCYIKGPDNESLNILQFLATGKHLKGCHGIVHLSTQQYMFNTIECYICILRYKKM